MSAQILQGPWVDASEAAIDQHRKTEVAVIVLDQNDRAVHQATVHIQQLRHDFVLGLTLPVDQLPPNDLSKRPVYRCFNAIALDRLTDWSFPPTESEHKPEDIAKAWQKAIDPTQVSFGRVISADPARNSDKIALLKPESLRNAVQARVSQAMQAQPQASRFDLYSDLLYQDMIERKLGMGMVHRMFESAHAKRPDARLALRVRDAISFQRGRELAQTAQRLEIQQVGFNSITIEQRFNGQIQPRSLGRLLDEQIGALPVPVTLALVEVGGPSGIAAGLNMETLLRLILAQPQIEGIYFAGLSQDALIEDNAALIDAEGQPTAAGTILDKLFHSHWRTDLTIKTDESGNANARVFTGWYHITATLPGGQTITGEAYIPKGERRKLIILQQTQAEAGKPE